jgi:glycosyltransferase involved in cell wall biosynthesis
MKICIVTPILFPEPGGPSIFVDRFIGSLRKDGHEVSVIAVGESDECLDKGKGCRIVKISRDRFLPLRIIKTIVQILKFGWKSDLLFSCGLFLESAVSKLLIQKPLVIRIGGDPVWERWTGREGAKFDLKEFQTTKHSVQIGLKKMLQQLSCQVADQVIIPSYFFKSVVEGWGVSERKIAVINNGIELDKMRLPKKEEMRNKLNLKKGQILLTIGRLIRLKRIDEIIQSFSEIKNDDSLLLIIGEGPQKEELIGLCYRLQLTERVKFLGTQSHSEVLQYLRASDLFVLNSMNEVMPNVVLESLAVGTPVIAPKVGGIPEIIEDGLDGLLFTQKENNCFELRGAMEQLLGDVRLKAKFIQNGFIKIRQFDWKNVYIDTLNVVNHTQRTTRSGD